MMDRSGSLSKEEERDPRIVSTHPTDETTRHLSFPGVFHTKITRFVLAAVRRYFNNGKCCFLTVLRARQFTNFCKRGSPKKFNFLCRLERSKDGAPERLAHAKRNVIVENSKSLWNLQNGLLQAAEVTLLWALHPRYISPPNRFLLELPSYLG